MILAVNIGYISFSPDIGRYYKVNIEPGASKLNTIGRYLKRLVVVFILLKGKFPFMGVSFPELGLSRRSFS